MATPREAASVPADVHEADPLYGPETEELFIPCDDSTNFHEEVNEDIAMREDAADLVEEEPEYGMTALMDVLQCLGVSAENASSFSSAIVRNKHRFHELRQQFEEQHRLVMAVSESKPTIVEIYGRGKLPDASHGCKRNLNADGLHALELRTNKANGQPWAVNLEADRQEALELVLTTKPQWIIGNPPCTSFSRLNINLNFPKMPAAEVKKRVDEGVRHLHFDVSLYKVQLDGGRRFLHEHPESATSWSDPWMQKLMSLRGVHSVVNDQRMYGLVTHNMQGDIVPAKKPTRFLTSSVQMASRLKTRCTREHKPEPLLAGRVAAAAFYPLPLITEILRGMRGTADGEHSSQKEPTLDKHNLSNAHSPDISHSLSVNL